MENVNDSQSARTTHRRRTEPETMTLSVEKAVQIFLPIAIYVEGWHSAQTDL